MKTSAIRRLSPEKLLIFVWLILLAGVSFGPIEYLGLRSLLVAAVVCVGLVLFTAGSHLGQRLARRRSGADPGIGVLRASVAAAALVGLAGIAMIAFDRVFLSGIDNELYAVLLRCAPHIVEKIAIARTPLIYIGYLTFSAAYASFALFILRAEEVRGWPAWLAQLSILSPIGYAVIYAGRMPILLAVAVLIGACLARWSQGRKLMPSGHWLILKGLVLVLGFAWYTNALWSERRDFCAQISPLVEELKAYDRIAAPELGKMLQAALGIPGSPAEPGPAEPGPADAGPGRDRPAAAGEARQPDSEEVQQRLAEKRRTLEPAADPWADFKAVMADSWHAKPSGYTDAAVLGGAVSPRLMRTMLSNYFYLTHGTMVISRVFSNPDRFSLYLGAYQISIIGPLQRVFAPESDFIHRMGRELKAAEVFGFFPSVWAAAYLDFGWIGGSVFILLWGFAGGFGYALRWAPLATPSLLLSFVFATILLSPIQGPFGVANSVLVGGWMLLLGILVDVTGILTASRRKSQAPEDASDRSAVPNPPPA